MAGDRAPRVGPNLCTSCGVLLCLTNWSASMQSYGRYVCSPCWTKRQHGYQVAGGEVVRSKKLAKSKTTRAAWTPERKEANRQRTYGNWLMRNYGISLERYNEMHTQQGGKCRICTTDRPRGRGGFHVDHCHATGAVRGLLCAPCNMMIGLAEDSPARLHAAIEYLGGAA